MAVAAPTVVAADFEEAGEAGSGAVASLAGVGLAALRALLEAVPSAEATSGRPAHSGDLHTVAEPMAVLLTAADPLVDREPRALLLITDRQAAGVDCRAHEARWPMGSGILSALLAAARDWRAPADLPMAALPGSATRARP